MTSFFSRLNPTPSFPHYTGPYTVGSTDVEIPVESIPCTVQRPHSSISTIAFRIYYPCTLPAKHHGRNVYWIGYPQRSILSAYARFLGANPSFANIFASFPNLLNHITIPAARDAPIADPAFLRPRSAASNDTHPNKPEAPPTRWPTLIFSHGLGGLRNAYSHLCGSLASYGMVVVAPDHRDGSQPIAIMCKTQSHKEASVDYQRIPHAPSDEVFAARDEQLKTRLWEMSAVVEALHIIDQGKEVNDLHSQDKHGNHGTATALQSFQNRLAISEPGSLAFAGHSFGATTVVQLLKSAFFSSRVTTPLFTIDPHAPQSDASIQNQVTATTPTILFDPWALPIKSPATKALANQPMPCYSAMRGSVPLADGSSLLAVLSSAFYNWRSNLHDVLHLLANPATSTQQQPTQIFYPAHSAHLSQSDFGILFPNVTKRFAKATEPERTLHLNVRAALEVLRRRNGVWDGLAPVDLTNEDGEVSEADGFVVVESEAKLGNDERRGDWRILSQQPDTVRGWIPILLKGDEKPIDHAAISKPETIEEPALGFEDEMRGAEIERENIA